MRWQPVATLAVGLLAGVALALVESGGFNYFPAVRLTSNGSGKALIVGVDGDKICLDGDPCTKFLSSTSATLPATTSESFTSTAASGSNGFACQTNGCRVDFGAGASDYASSDGTTVAYPGPVQAKWLTLPPVDALPPCNVSGGAPVGSMLVYGTKSLECTPLLPFLGFPVGSWAMLGVPPLTPSGQMPSDPKSVASTAGLIFGERAPGTFHLGLRLVTCTVSQSGTCGGGCTPGTDGYMDVIQEASDGGFRLIASLPVPCTAAPEFCVQTSNLAASNCHVDGGIFNLILPEAVGGNIGLEWRADAGSLCTIYPVGECTADGVQGLFPDAGAP